MSEWWSYRPRDFLMFSARVFERLFELHNLALWPAQVVALVLGTAVLIALLRPRPGTSRPVALLLAASWLFVAWAFLWQRYAPINWGIRYVIPLFGLQALLLVAVGLAKGGVRLPTRWSVPRGLGIVLFGYALALHPWITAFHTGRGLTGAEVIGLFPDPLAIATLGVAAMADPPRRAWLLFVIPALWCLISGFTLYLLAIPGAWIPPMAMILALTARLWPGNSSGG